MKRLMLLAVGTALGALLMLSGCHKSCGACHAKVEKAPCCAPESGGTVIERREAPPVEHRTEAPK